MADDTTQALSESAKAVQEVAKLGESAIDAGLKAGGWLDRIFGSAVEDTVGLHWSDRVRARRIEAAIYDWERLQTLVHRTAIRLQKKGITATRLVPPKIALPLLENATIEHEDDLHILWSTLLANALDPSADEVEKKFISTLSELTGADAKVFAHICHDWLNSNRHSEFTHPSLRFEPCVDGTDAHPTISVITLNRLGLIAPAFTEFDTYEPEDPTNWKEPRRPIREAVRAYGDLTFVTVTAFGEAFYKAAIL